MPPSDESAAPQQARRRTLLNFLFAFACVFAGLALPFPGVGPIYVTAHALIGNAFVQGELDSGVRLSFVADPDQLKKNPWQATLVVRPNDAARTVLMPIDLRALAFLPTAAFIALAAAAPLRSWRGNLRLLAIGLPLLELVLLALLATPVLSFLGGTGPVQAFSLSPAAHAFLQVVYRALVAPPGMAFALPLFLWWILVVKLGGFADAAQVPTQAHSGSTPGGS